MPTCVYDTRSMFPIVLFEKHLGRLLNGQDRVEIAVRPSRNVCFGDFHILQTCRVTLLV